MYILLQFMQVASYISFNYKKLLITSYNPVKTILISRVLKIYNLYPKFYTLVNIYLTSQKHQQKLFIIYKFVTIFYLIAKMPLYWILCWKSVF